MGKDLNKGLGHKRIQIQRAVLSWSKRHLRQFPWRNRERTPYTVLLAELLLKRTTAKSAERLFHKMLNRYPTIDSLNCAPEEELQALIREIGLQYQRTRSIKEVAKAIVSGYNGKIPNNMEDLLRIPHVGPYTAGAVLSFGYGKPAPIVDSNVERIIRRILADEVVQLTSTHILEVAKELLPEKGHALYNWGLLDIGAVICTYRAPLCVMCPLNLDCDTGRRSCARKEILR